MITYEIKTPQYDDESIDCLIENLDLIRSNKKFILSKKEYRGIRINGIFAAGLYVGGTAIPLGVLLDLWDNTNWHTDDKLYLNIIGSPLSGMNNCCWINLQTKKKEYGRVSSWRYLAPIAMNRVSNSKDEKSFINKLQKWSIDNKSLRCSFADWSKKVENNETIHLPQPKRSISKLTIQALVEILKQKSFVDAPKS